MDGNDSVTTVANGRASNGRFSPGNGYGRGSPVAKRMHELRAALLNAATPEKTQEVIRKLGEQAAAGDVPSAKVYLEHTCGKPLQAISLSGPEGEPLGGDLAKLRAVILAALAKHPEARHEVARALMSLRNADDERSDDPGIVA